MKRTVTDLPTPAALGLRERKKQKTRNAIQREAMRLFAKQGYAETTIEQIAEAVEISPSTFFNYFPSKEELIAFDDYDPLLAAAFAARPKDEPLGIAIRRAIVDQLSTILKRDRDLVLARAKLALSVPELRARFWEETQKSQDFVQKLITQRTRKDPNAYEVRVAASIIVSAMFVAVLEWVSQDGRDDLAKLVNRALDVVEAGAGL
jgi:AcrR family transcriptional regulator